MTHITSLRTCDLRFPTLKLLDGSDAMNPDPDYSAAYVILETDHPDGLSGHGFTFTIGRANEPCVAGIKIDRGRYRAPLSPGFSAEIRSQSIADHLHAERASRIG